MADNSLWPGKGKWFLLAGLILLGFILITVFSPKSPNEILNPVVPIKEVVQEPYTPARKLKIEGKPEAWMIQGSNSAIISLVEFSDFTCPHCLASYKALDAIKDKYASKVRLVIRSYTPTQRSINLSLAAHCAGEQGKFWEMHNALFANVSDTFGNNYQDVSLLASKLKINMADFSACITNQKYLEDIKKDNQAAQELKIPGTPTWYFNGQVFSGELTYEALDNYLAELTK